MLKFRNISLLRRIYVWGLGVITRVAYGPDIRAAASPEAALRVDAARLRRINLELEFGSRAWQTEFLESSGRASLEAKDEPFHLEDTASFVSDGVQALVGDTLSACFTSDPPDPWNFLTRNIPAGSWQMTPYNTLLWLVGIWARYCVFLPFRFMCIVVGVISFVCAWPLVSGVPGPRRKRTARQWLLRYLSSVVVASWSGYIKFHGKRPERRPNQIYVANHTSLIDLFILNKDYNFSCIGQRHSGLAGGLQNLLMAAQDHIWFDREEGSDRRAVHRLLRAHVADGSKEPMLVFPEGTCTNSESCVMFKKGSFELGAEVHPIAMRYRRRFGDPFWNSQTTSFPRHLFDLMTSWAVVCDVYYMEPECIREGETGVQFANRVKRLICERAGLVSVNWDGFLKRHRISPKFLDSRQRALASVITRRINGELPRSVSGQGLATIDCGHPQTTDAGDGTTVGSGMDTLSYDRDHMSEVGRAARTEGNLQRSGSLYRDVLGLGRRREGRIRGNMRVGVVEWAVRNTMRWMLGIGLLVVAAVVTSRLMPESWKQAVRDVLS